MATHPPFGLSRLIYPEKNPVAGNALDYKTHILIGLRQDAPAVVLIAGWNRLPTQEEIAFAVSSNTAYTYRQYALLNATNVWNTDTSTGS